MPRKICRSRYRRNYCTFNIPSNYSCKEFAQLQKVNRPKKLIDGRLIQLLTNLCFSNIHGNLIMMRKKKEK